MCTSWNTRAYDIKGIKIITYWEMCTSWNANKVRMSG